ncbi:Alcohol dehydrogenase [cytochrome c] precursor [Bremerella volcania]|uniref:Alcohol dehydrogenase [cytochrome c] n=1 Tax=Bremerella volcania TaxID=2527984 RepID=A0A518C2Z0_9BACT|nr:PQQ-binding-like beta-propeller repeat protein [Bremerella volcania]QDU73597.1 Alcohol dehydrogenase [cytochrome c] precursor [Bremerella volcania]
MSASYRFLLCTTMLAISCTGLHAEDWPQWQGPNRDSVSNETQLKATWPEEGPHLAWQVNDLGDGYGAVSVADGVIFLVVNEGLDDESVKALDATNGQVLWATRIGKVGNPNQKPSYPAARSTPTVDGEMVYVLGSDGDLVCLKAKSGEVVWQKNVRQDYDGKPGTWAYSESPLVDGSKVIVTPGGPEVGIVAVDKSNGKTIWEAKTPEMGAAAYASIQKVTAAGKKQYVAFMANGLAGVDAEDGTFLWSYKRTKGIANMPTPVIAGDIVYSGGSRTGGGAVRLIAKQLGVLPEELYFNPKLPNAIGGSVKVDDYLYGCSGSTLLCVNFLTGEIEWQERISAAASILYADGRLYLHTEDGKVMMVAATPEKMEIVSEFTLPDQPEGTGKEWAYPVLANGKLYLRQHGTLWCYDVK